MRGPSIISAQTPGEIGPENLRDKEQAHGVLSLTLRNSMK